MNEINERLYSQALHEAAHIVVALHFGWWISVNGISLEQNHDLDSSNAHQSIFSKNHQTLESRISILLAGELISYNNAQETGKLSKELIKRIDNHDQAERTSDLYQALNLARQELADFQKAKEYIMESALATLQIINKHSRAITEFADFLYSKKHVDYADFIEFTFSATHFKKLLDK